MANKKQRKALTQSEIEGIKKMVEANEDRQVIADKFDITRETVNKYIRKFALRETAETLDVPLVIKQKERECVNLNCKIEKLQQDLEAAREEILEYKQANFFLNQKLGQLLRMVRRGKHE